MVEEKKQMEEVVARYLDGSVTPAETKLLSDWLNESAENRKMFQEMKWIWDGTVPSDQNSPQVEAALDRFRKRRTQTTVRPFLRRSYLAVASIAAILILGLIVFLVQKPGVLLAQNSIEHCTEKMALVLEDGTKVWLNKGSSFDYPSRFDQKIREVRLDGEAYFEVIKDSKRPFVVRAKDASIQVLGTRFNFKSSRNGTYSEAVLLSGRIRMTVEKSGQVVDVVPNQRVLYTKPDGRLLLEQVDAGIYNTWKNSHLEFDNRKLGDVIVELEKWYNLDIVCPQDLQDRIRVSFVVEKESLLDVLNAMKLIAPITWTVKDGQVVLKAL